MSGQKVKNRSEINSNLLSKFVRVLRKFPNGRRRSAKNLSFLPPQPQSFLFVCITHTQKGLRSRNCGNWSAAATDVSSRNFFANFCCQLKAEF